MRRGQLDDFLSQRDTHQKQLEAAGPRREQLQDRDATDRCCKRQNRAARPNDERQSATPEVRDGEIEVLL